ncbi:hypothetical protein [Xanthobacter flavus]
MTHTRRIDTARRAALKREAEAQIAAGPYAPLAEAMKARRAELAHDGGSE